MSDEDRGDLGGEEFASDAIQSRISALLADAARAPQTHASNTPDDLRMPADVEARIRAALSAEMGRPLGGSPVDSTGVPHESTHQVGSSRGAETSGQTGASSAHDRASSADIQRPATVVPLPQNPQKRAASAPAAASSATPTATPASATGAASSSTSSSSSVSPTTPHRESSSSASSGVSSLSEHRDKKQSRSRLLRAATALGAAAAVAIGGVAILKNSHSAGSPPAAQASSSARANFADVSITNTGTAYTAASYPAEAAKVIKSQIPTIPPEEARKLSSIATQSGLNSCVSALNHYAAAKPDHVYADFGTFEGKPALLIVTETKGVKTAWIVQRGCSEQTGSEKLAGPNTLSA